ncbi:MAG: GNAT family N-acetyltransferase [Pseudomonadota bacterium]
MTCLEPGLIAGWLRARSVARGLPLPVADHGGWRVDTGLAHELRRYVFARAEDSLRILAETISAPHIYLKLCGSEQEMRALLTPRWEIQEPRFVMTGDAYAPAYLPLPAGYCLQLTRCGATTTARIVTAQGAVAASGYAAEVNDYFIYDQIATAPEHRRRGLGACLMRSLYSTRRSPTSIQVLVATAQGQALYSALGWRIRSPYTTAHIPH